MVRLICFHPAVDALDIERNPTHLLYYVFHFIAKLFGVRGGDDSRALEKEQITLGFDEQNNRRYIELAPGNDKTHRFAYLFSNFLLEVD